MCEYEIENGLHTQKVTEETGNNIEMKVLEQQRGSSCRKWLFFCFEKFIFSFFPVFNLNLKVSISETKDAYKIKMEGVIVFEFLDVECRVSVCVFYFYVKFARLLAAPNEMKNFTLTRRVRRASGVDYFCSKCCPFSSTYR